jgi:hypothetical protein
MFFPGSFVSSAGKLDVPGEKRLDIDYGTPIKEILV